MNIEKRLKEIRIACKIADWFSVEQHVDYDFDISLGILFAEGRIAFYNGDILSVPIRRITHMEEKELCRRPWS